MIVDTHCHFDMMENPEQYIGEQERRGNIIIGMTNLPSHFEMGFPHVRQYKFIRLALGMHPQLANESEQLIKFKQLVDKTSYIGEIGLDYSPSFVSEKDKQLHNFEYILQLIKDKKKIVSVHSKDAENDVLALLLKYKIPNVIFHWYSGEIKYIADIISAGYYFSINEAMTRSKKGLNIISRIPRNRILTESDAPFNSRCSIPKTIEILGLSEQEILFNWNQLLDKIR